MLLDFENNTTLRNQVVDFSAEKKETKQAALRRLAATLTEWNEKIEFRENYEDLKELTEFLN